MARQLVVADRDLNEILACLGIGAETYASAVVKKPVAASVVIATIEELRIHE